MMIIFYTPGQVAEHYRERASQCRGAIKSAEAGFGRGVRQKDIARWRAEAGIWEEAAELLGYLDQSEDAPGLAAARKRAEQCASA